MKKQIDNHKIAQEFNVGDWDYLKLQHYRQLSVVVRKYQKVSKRFYGR